MHFQPANVDDFLEIFQRTKDAIRNRKGCLHLELLRDAGQENVFVTISHWKDKSDLDQYRSSELFKKVWARVKPLFSQPTEAYTLEPVLKVD
jgi:quinol monooxygenase YgiN